MIIIVKLNKICFVLIYFGVK